MRSSAAGNSSSLYVLSITGFSFHLSIAAAIAAAGREDIVLVAGKGHEQGQIVGRGAEMRVLPFDDVTVARECAAAGGNG